MAGSERYDQVRSMGSVLGADGAGGADGPDGADVADVASTATPTHAPAPVDPEAGRHGRRLHLPGLRRRRPAADARFVAPPPPAASGPVRFDERVRTAAELAAGRPPASPLAEAGQVA